MARTAPNPTPPLSPTGLDRLLLDSTEGGWGGGPGDSDDSAALGAVVAAALRDRAEDEARLGAGEGGEERAGCSGGGREGVVGGLMFVHGRSRRGWPESREEGCIQGSLVCVCVVPLSHISQVAHGAGMCVS